MGQPAVRARGNRASALGKLFATATPHHRHNHCQRLARPRARLHCRPPWHRERAPAVLKIVLVGAYPALFTVFFCPEPDRWVGTSVHHPPARVGGSPEHASPHHHDALCGHFCRAGACPSSLLADGLLVTYRSFFILLETFGRLVHRLALARGLFALETRRFKQMAEVVGVTFCTRSISPSSPMPFYACAAMPGTFLQVTVGAASMSTMPYRLP